MACPYCRHRTDEIVIAIDSDPECTNSSIGVGVPMNGNHRAYGSRTHFIRMYHLPSHVFQHVVSFSIGSRTHKRNNFVDAMCSMCVRVVYAVVESGTHSEVGGCGCVCSCNCFVIHSMLFRFRKFRKPHLIPKYKFITSLHFASNMVKFIQRNAPLSGRQTAVGLSCFYIYALWFIRSTLVLLLLHMQTKCSPTCILHSQRTAVALSEQWLYTAYRRYHLLCECERECITFIKPWSNIEFVGVHTAALCVQFELLRIPDNSNNNKNMFMCVCVCRVSVQYAVLSVQCLVSLSIEFRFFLFFFFWNSHTLAV